MGLGLENVLWAGAIGLRRRGVAHGEQAGVQNTAIMRHRT